MEIRVKIVWELSRMEIGIVFRFIILEEQILKNSCMEEYQI